MNIILFLEESRFYTFNGNWSLKFDHPRVVHDICNSCVISDFCGYLIAFLDTSCILLRAGETDPASSFLSKEINSFRIIHRPSNTYQLTPKKFCEFHVFELHHLPEKIPTHLSVNFQIACYFRLRYNPLSVYILSTLVSVHFNPKMLTKRICSTVNILPYFQIFLLFITGKLEILKEIATAKKELPKFYRTWAFLL